MDNIQELLWIKKNKEDFKNFIRYLKDTNRLIRYYRNGQLNKRLFGIDYEYVTYFFSKMPSNVLDNFLKDVDNKITRLDDRTTNRYEIL